MNVCMRPKTKKSGFTIAELLVVMAIIMLLASVVMSSITKARDKAIAARLATDFKTIKDVEEMYVTQNAIEPCHMHNMGATTNIDEAVWSQPYIKNWPISPSQTKYFFTHSGDTASPTSSDYYYIGVVLDPKYAQLYDSQFDDGNPSGGLFRSQTSPSPHYSYFLSFVTSGSHKHCR